MSALRKSRIDPAAVVAPQFAEPGRPIGRRHRRRLGLALAALIELDDPAVAVFVFLRVGAQVFLPLLLGVVGRPFIHRRRPPGLPVATADVKAGEPGVAPLSGQAAKPDG